MSDFVKIAWVDNPDITDDSHLILETPVLSGPAAGSLVERSPYSFFYIRNTGTLSAQDVGFFIEANQGDRNGFANMEELLKWGSITDPNNVPYGFYTVFGYDDSNQSYINKFLNGTVTPSEAGLFLHTWVQGAGPRSKIRLGSAKTWRGTVYAASDELPIYSAVGSALPNKETKGIVRVMAMVRIPPGVAPVRIKINHNVYFIENL